jgi:hypothetical protein
MLATGERAPPGDSPAMINGSKEENHAATQ